MGYAPMTPPGPGRHLASGRTEMTLGTTDPADAAFQIAAVAGFAGVSATARNISMVARVGAVEPLLPLGMIGLSVTVVTTGRRIVQAAIDCVAGATDLFIGGELEVGPGAMDPGGPRRHLASGGTEMTFGTTHASAAASVILAMTTLTSVGVSAIGAAVKLAALFVEP